MSSAFTGGAGGFTSQRFDSLSSYGEGGEEPAKEVADGDDDDGDDTSYVAGDDVFASTEMERKGQNLPPPEVIEPKEGMALREWRRQNTIRLEEKEKREKEIVRQVIEEAEEYRSEYYRKWKHRVDNHKAANKEKEKLFLENQSKFHSGADKNYWKAIAELIPREVAMIEKKGNKKDQEMKPSIVVLQGPKPSKPTDLSRMRQVLVKLKHNPPPHMEPPILDPRKAAETGTITPAANAPSKSLTTASPEATLAVAK